MDQFVNERQVRRIGSVFCPDINQCRKHLKNISTVFDSHEPKAAQHSDGKMPCALYLYAEPGIW